MTDRKHYHYLTLLIYHLFRRIFNLKTILIYLLLFGVILTHSACDSTNSTINSVKKTTDVKSKHKKEVPINISTKKQNFTLPSIDNSAQKITISTLKKNEVIKDARISIKNDQVSLNLLLNAAIDLPYAEQFGKKFAQMLATNTQIGNEPGNNYLGGLWDIYSSNVTVEGPSKNIIVQGKKYPSDSSIIWG